MSLYSAFGLTIESPLSLPELPAIPAAAAPDVSIVFGHVDTDGFAPRASESSEMPWWQAVPSDREIFFRYGAGTFHITDGSLITVDAAPDTPAETLRSYLLGSALGAAQIQRGRLPLHGGAVVSRGRAVVLTGDQGAGKSTMTSALVHAGFPYLTDDVVSMDCGGDTPLAYPAYPQRKLMREACVQLGFTPENLPVADASRSKFAVRNRENWHDAAVPAGILVELVPSPAGEKLRAEQIIGHACLRLLTRSLYRPWMHLQNGSMPASEIKKILAAAAVVTSYRVHVPRELSRLSQFADELSAALNLI